MRIFLILTFLGSIGAHACPNLSGSYTCALKDGTKEQLTISQEDHDGVTTYVFYNDVRFSADNKKLKLTDDENYKDATIRAWCDPSTPTTLTTELVARYHRNSVFVGDMTLVQSYLIDGDVLKQNATGTVKVADEDLPLNHEQECVRN